MSKNEKWKYFCAKSVTLHTLTENITAEIIKQQVTAFMISEKKLAH